ncbi:MAG: hypothetical protein JNK33_04005 [Candidatus Doudnabacteria bacterium]|nr:hypothetical protein [Candidatus Doudnabacteria bacterium]
MPYRSSLREGNSSAYILIHNSGKDGQILFRSPADFDRFVVLVKQLLRSAETVRLLGFALLQDSFYLILHEQNRGAAARLIQRLSIAYSIYFNAKYEKTGKVFQGPYKDMLLSPDDQLMQMLCKVHGLPRLQHADAETYQWSSYRYYLTRRGTWIDKSFTQKYFANPSYQNDLRHMTAIVQVNLPWQPK